MVLCTPEAAAVPESAPQDLQPRRRLRAPPGAGSGRSSPSPDPGPAPAPGLAGGREGAARPGSGWGGGDVSADALVSVGVLAAPLGSANLK